MQNDVESIAGECKGRSVTFCFAIQWKAEHRKRRLATTRGTTRLATTRGGWQPLANILRIPIAVPSLSNGKKLEYRFFPTLKMA